MKHLNRSAFTLTELIVTIVIVSILATIGFISLQGFMKDARNSARATDVKTVQKVLQLHYVENVSYPMPDDAQTVSYSGDVVHYQGTFGMDAVRDVRKISTPPLDPTMQTEYVYSVDVSRSEYEILALYEDGLFAVTPPGVASVYADSGIDNPVPLVSGVYNQIFVETQNYTVPLPSIINSEVSSSSVELSNDTIDSYVVSRGENIPQIGSQISAVTRSESLNLVAFEGKITKESTDAQKLELANLIQNSMGGNSFKKPHPTRSRFLGSNVDNEKISLVNQIFRLNDPYAAYTAVSEADGAGGICDFSSDDAFDGSCNFGL